MTNKEAGVENLLNVETGEIFNKFVDEYRFEGYHNENVSPTNKVPYRLVVETQQTIVEKTNDDSNADIETNEV